MQWEKLTSTELARAVQSTGGVCVIGMGVIEKHSEHLPLGTDFLNAHRVACLAAQKESAVVFPPFYFGQIYEARCFPGTVTIRPALLLELIQGVFDEIGRNGFRKIIVHNGHGGNWHLLDFIAQSSLWEEKPYSVHIQTKWLTPERQKSWDEILETKVHGHACECETSISLANHPELVKMDRVPEKPALPLGRLDQLKPSLTGIWWYADQPDHYRGDARPATAEKGKILMDLMVDTLAEFIAAVKKDETSGKLMREFFSRERDLRKG